MRICIHLPQCDLTQNLFSLCVRATTEETHSWPGTCLMFAFIYHPSSLNSVLIRRKSCSQSEYWTGPAGEKIEEDSHMTRGLLIITGNFRNWNTENKVKRLTNCLEVNRAVYRKNSVVFTTFSSLQNRRETGGS